MSKIIEANQSKPYELMKNVFKHGNEYKELLYIIKNNQPNISAEEIIEMLKGLSNSGCSCANLANTIGEQIFKDDSEFQEMFGFSLYINGTDKINYNKLLVDIYSKLYGVGKVKFIEYDQFVFNSATEACNKLLNKNCNSENEAFIELFNNGYSGDGYTENGKMLFKSRSPKISNFVGSASDIARNKFGIDGINSFNELKNICLKRNIGFECRDLEIQQKLTGIGSNNFNFWCNYYLKSHNLDFNLIQEEIPINNTDYNNFKSYISNLILQNYSISVASTPNSDVYMHTKKKLSWMKFSSEKAGHIMMLKGFDNNEDIVVSSYGEDYIIPKEYFNLLEFKKIYKKSITKYVDEVKDTKAK